MVNHASEAERIERPEGDLRNLVLATNEDAYVNAEGALVAEARVASAWADFVNEFHDCALLFHVPSSFCVWFGSGVAVRIEIAL